MLRVSTNQPPIHSTSSWPNLQQSKAVLLVPVAGFFAAVKQNNTSLPELIRQAKHSCYVQFKLSHAGAKVGTSWAPPTRVDDQHSRLTSEIVHPKGLVAGGSGFHHVSTPLVFHQTCSSRLHPGCVSSWEFLAFHLRLALGQTLRYCGESLSLPSHLQRGPTWYHRRWSLFHTNTNDKSSKHGALTPRTGAKNIILLVGLL